MKWWKILGVLIVVVVHVAGLLIPIGIGITGVSPYQLTGGEDISLNIKTYNADVSHESADIRAWLKYDNDHLIQAESISVSSESSIDAMFQLPNALPKEKTKSDLTLIVDFPDQGTAILPGAVYVKEAGSNVSNTAKWSNLSLSELNVKTTLHFPYRSILLETIRNTYFHVSLWMAMMLLLMVAVFYSVRVLKSNNLLDDAKSNGYTEVGFLFGILGLLTGMVWAKYTWGRPWSWDIKQITTAIALLIYAAYFLLRTALDDPYKKARISAIFNIFAFIALIPLLYILPRMSESLHPGNGGNPAMGGEDLDNTMRMIFYPAIIGWALVGAWIAQLRYRIKNLENISNKI